MAINRYSAPTGRLRFETNLVQPQVSGRAVRAFLAGLCAIVLSIGAGWLAPGVFNSFFHKNGDRALAQLAKTVTEALRTGALDPAIALTVDDKAARERISQLPATDPHTVLAGAVSKENAANSAETCRTFLSTMRTEMARQGMAWDQVHPLGFGGVVASVSASDDRGRDAAKSALGDIYFACNKKVFALEFSARQCGNTYVIMDFWRCAPVETTPENLKQYALTRFQSMTQQPDAPNLPVDVKQIRCTYIAVD